MDKYEQAAEAMVSQMKAQHEQKAATSEIAEVEVFFVVDEDGFWGIGFTGADAREVLEEHAASGISRRHFSIRVRARKPCPELGPEIDIADRDVEVAGVTEVVTLPEEAQLPHPSRSSQHSS